MPCLRDSGSQWNCAPENDCLRNLYKSFKAMGPDVVVSMAKSLQHEGIKLGALVADDVLLQVNSRYNDSGYNIIPVCTYKHL